MNDTELRDAWTTLSPTAAQNRRIETRVLEWLEARDTPLAAEWLTLVRFEPFAAMGLAVASAIALGTATPLFWFARALMAR